MAQKKINSQLQKKMYFINSYRIRHILNVSVVNDGYTADKELVYLTGQEVSLPCSQDPTDLVQIMSH
jgi:hypothetical protein